jgi:4-amino-4-deoxy-L-arabinose transferase-like glycosyltransferase
VKDLSKETLVLLSIVCFLGLGLRLGHIHYSVVPEPYIADAGEYTTAAANLLDHGVYSTDKKNDPPIPDSFRSPGYPLFLALVRAVVGAERFYDVVRYLQAILSTLVIPLIFILALRFLPSGWALGVAALTATSPHLIVVPGYLLTETLFSFLLVLALTLLYGSLTARKTVQLILAGVCFGLAALTNETALVIPPVLAVGYLWWGRGVQRLLPATLFLVAFAVFPGGLKIRNALSVPPEGRKGSTRALATLVHGTYPGFVHKDPNWRYYPYKLESDPQYPEFSRSWKDFRRIFAERFSERPGRYVRWYLLEKPYYLWGWSYLQGTGDIYIYATVDSVFDVIPASRLLYHLHRLLHPLLVALALISGFVWFFTRKKADLFATAGPLFMVLLLYTLIAMVFAPWPRYTVPLRPLFFAAALWTPVAIWRMRRPQSER